MPPKKRKAEQAKPTGTRSRARKERGTNAERYDNFGRSGGHSRNYSRGHSELIPCWSTRAHVDSSKC